MGSGKHWNSCSFESTPLGQDGLVPTCRWFSGTLRNQMHVNEDGQLISAHGIEILRGANVLSVGGGGASGRAGTSRNVPVHWAP